MRLGDLRLEVLSRALRQSSALRAKHDVQRIARRLSAAASGIRNGDDAAAIPDRDGFTLLAAEGMLPSFVAAEPFFAGFCAVMTNVSDIAAMGGRPSALVDVLFASSDAAHTDQILAGLAAGAETFGVPLVGGHTARSAEHPYLAAAIVGRARHANPCSGSQPIEDEPMPELRFQLRWPDDECAWYYSPSSTIREHFDAGASYPMNEFLTRARAALQHAAERVRAKYGFYCSSAIDTLHAIEAKAAAFDRDTQHVQLLGFSDSA